MKRVLHNVELLVPRLEKRGWKALTGKMLRELSAEEQDCISVIEATLEWKIPPSLLGFWQTVGDVDFVWDYNQPQAAPVLCKKVPVTFAELDPLSIGAVQASELEYLEDWADENGRFRVELRRPFYIDLAPDYCLKINESGAGPYGIELPFDGADPDFQGPKPRMPFVDYLRDSLRLGGFPRLKRYEHEPEVKSLLQELTDGFLDF